MTPTVPFRPLPVELDNVRYELGPDSRRRPGVPPGETVELRWAWRDAAPAAPTSDAPPSALAAAPPSDPATAQPSDPATDPTTEGAHR